MYPLGHFYRLCGHRLIERPLWRAYHRRHSAVFPEAQFKQRFCFATAETSRSEFVGELMWRVRERFFFSPKDQLRLTRFLSNKQEIVDAAEKVVSNTVNLLGSGERCLGATIDWHQDFKSGKVWPIDYCSDLTYAQGDGSDIKVPWELSRFHQLLWLGKGYWLTGDPRYPSKFRELVEAWIDANPFGYGIHWINAMEVSFRACNWILGVGFFADAPGLLDEFWMRFFQQLFLHGEFVRYNLELERVVGNHYLSNGVGLIFLGSFFQDTAAGKSWLNWGKRILEREIRHQVHSDGADFEKSISYHRLVLEMLYCAFICGQRSQVVFSKGFKKRLERMFDFTANYTKPNGKVPRFSDSDNGRLFRFSRDEDFNDHRGALAIGAVLFERPDFKCAAGSQVEDLIWFLGEKGLNTLRGLPHTQNLPVSRAFQDSGYYILRDRSAHMIIDAGKIGPYKVGVHGHNDTFSFELFFGGEEFITDSGTYAYTSNFETHQRFASTAAHNTVRIDNREIAEFDGIWRIKADLTYPQVREWSSNTRYDILEVQHHGYSRLTDSVIHRRRFEFNKPATTWLIHDWILGRGNHQCELFFHLSEGISAQPLGDCELRLEGTTAALHIQCSVPLMILDGEISPIYGVKVPARILYSVQRGEVPLEFITRISVED